MDDLAVEKISRILRIDKKRLADLEQQLDEVSGKRGMLHNITEQNEEIMRRCLDRLGLGRNVGAFEVYDALISKIESDDLKIFDALNLFSFRNPDTAQKIVDFVKKIHPPAKGYFLKHEKAIEFLKSVPPKKILAALGYDSVEKMLEKEDLLEVYSALRFLEDSDWQNKIFFKQYEHLKAEDFEERDIQLRALDPKWASAAEKFTKKKRHNVSHLKELGVIFIIPTFLGISGETLRLISLLLHYLNEVEYYSDLFKYFSKSSDSFAGNFISLLRGDVIESREMLPFLESSRPRFLVIQRYLAKDDSNDWRLFEPHVNPEALHWSRAGDETVRIEKILPEIKDGLDFWKGLDWIGDYFKDNTGNEVLVSFNLVDTVMSLVKEREMIKYLYHHQEALWNRIFSGYFGQEKMIELMKKNMIKGWFEA